VTAPIPNREASFDAQDAAIELHYLLAKEIRNRGIALDLVYQGTSGVITVFEPAHWARIGSNAGAGRNSEVCDIFPTRHRTWFVEWRDGKTFHGSGGPLAFVEVLMRGISENLH